MLKIIILLVVFLSACQMMRKSLINWYLKIGLIAAVCSCLFLFMACTYMTDVQIRLFTMKNGSRTRISSTGISLFRIQRHIRWPVYRLKGHRDLFSLSNYYVGRSARGNYLQLQVVVPGYRVISKKITNLSVYPRGGSSPYPYLIDVLLRR